MTYEDAVQQAASALIRGEDANWDLARLTFENTVGQGRRAATEDRATLDEWSAAIRAKSGRRFSARTAGLYRRVWIACGPLNPQEIVGLSWTEAVSEINASHRPDALPERMPNLPLGLGKDRTPEATPERKVEVFQALANDPDVQAAVTHHGAPRAAVNKLVQLGEKADAVHRELEYSQDPVSQHLDSHLALLHLSGATRRYVAEVDRLWPFLKGATDPLGTTDFLKENNDEAAIRTQRVARLLETGETDLDSAINDILHQGA